MSSCLDMFKKNKWNICEQDSSWQFFGRKHLTWKISVLNKNYQFVAIMFEKKNILKYDLINKDRIYINEIFLCNIFVQNNCLHNLKKK